MNTKTIQHLFLITALLCAGAHLHGMDEKTKEENEKKVFIHWFNTFLDLGKNHLGSKAPTKKEYKDFTEQVENELFTDKVEDMISGVFLYYPDEHARNIVKKYINKPIKISNSLPEVTPLEYLIYRTDGYDSYGYSMSGTKLCAEYLMDLGAKLNQQTLCKAFGFYDQHPLLSGRGNSLGKDFIDFVMYLVRSCNINLNTPIGEQIFIRAVDKNDTYVIRWLIISGFSGINNKILYLNSYSTALHLTVKNKNLSMFKSLLECGADIHGKDGKNQTVRDYELPFDDYHNFLIKYVADNFVIHQKDIVYLDEQEEAQQFMTTLDTYKKSSLSEKVNMLKTINDNPYDWDFYLQLALNNSDTTCIDYLIGIKDSFYNPINMLKIMGHKKSISLDLLYHIFHKKNITIKNLKDIYNNIRKDNYHHTKLKRAFRDYGWMLKIFNSKISTHEIKSTILSYLNPEDVYQILHHKNN